MLAMLALLAFSFTFTSCSKDEDQPDFTNTVNITGTNMNVTAVTRSTQTAIHDSETTYYLETFILYTSGEEGVAVYIPQQHLGKTMDLTKKWGIDGDLPAGIYAAINGKGYAFFCPDENGDFDGNFKEGTMTVTADDSKVTIYAKGIGLYYETPESDPVEMPFEISYSGAYTIPVK